MAVPDRLWLAAALVLVLGAVLRFSYYDSGHGPDDEDITIEVVRQMRHSGDWDVNWAKADLPPSLRYDQYNFSSHLYATYFFYRLTKWVPGTDRWRSEREGFLVYRFFVAALATLVVGQTLLLGWRVAGPLGGLGAAALTAVAPLLVQDAHYVRPEPFTTVLMLAAVHLSWPQVLHSRRRIFAAGLCVGLLIACKVSMLLIAWVPFVSILAARPGGTARGWLASAAGLGILLGFCLGAPTAVMHPHAFVHGVGALMAQYAGLHPPHSHLLGTPVTDMLARYFAATLGWPLLASVALGAGWLVARRRWAELGLIAGPVIVFAAYFATRKVFFERNLSHVVPLFALVAAVGIVHSAGWLAAKVRLTPAIIAAIFFGAACARGAAITWPLLAVEYSGRADAQHNGLENEMRARYPDAEWRSVTLLLNGLEVQLAERFSQNPAPVLLGVTDYRDEWTAWNLGLLQRQLVVTEVARTDGTFPEVPTSTLLTYYRPTTRYLLVTGVRPP